MGHVAHGKKSYKGCLRGQLTGLNGLTSTATILFINTEVCNIADDTTPYACEADLKSLLQNLEGDVASALLWFDANYMKPNQPKCHFLAPSQTSEQLWIQVGEQIIWESRQERLLGVMVDKELSFKQHIEDLCKKAGAKVTALARLIRIVSMEKKGSL